jgi:hypothetical protein
MLRFSKEYLKDYSKHREREVGPVLTVHIPSTCQTHVHASVYLISPLKVILVIVSACNEFTIVFFVAYVSDQVQKVALIVNRLNFLLIVL